jgi:hypothetical protein
MVDQSVETVSRAAKLLILLAGLVKKATIFGPAVFQARNVVDFPTIASWAGWLNVSRSEVAYTLFSFLHICMAF